ncbi:MAG: helix-turn-helix domain-containing protein [Candidatus Thermoplasmatota archaeon]
MDAPRSPTLLQAHLVVRHWGCIVSEGLTDGAKAVQVSADQAGDVLVMHAVRPEQIEAFIDGIEKTEEGPAEIVLRTPNTVVLRARPPTWGVVTTINESGCSILWPAIWQDGLERYTVIAPTRDRLDVLVRTLSEIGDVRVESVSEVEAAQLAINVPLADLTERLTPRQFEAITLAIRKGYYESPRRTPAQALAKSLGLSRSTFEEHLRKAELHILERVGGALAAHPALAAGARGRAGRRSQEKRAGRQQE